MNIEQIKDKIDGLMAKKLALEVEIEKEFETDLNKLVELYKNSFDSITIGVNNHGFNDGDPTYYSLNFEYDMTLRYEDDLGNSYEVHIDDDVTESNKKYHNILNEFEELFYVYDRDGFYEKMYGKKYDSEIEIKSK